MNGYIMAKKQERISINNFEKIVKDTYTPTEVIDWHGTSVTVKKTLSLEDIMSFCHIMADGCFSDDGKYIASVKDFLFKRAMISFYTNIAIPKNIEKAYELIYCSDIIESIIPAINAVQFNELKSAVENQIKYETELKANMLYGQIEKMYEGLDQIESQLASVFENIKKEDISKFAESLLNGKLDEEKLVKAYIENTKTDNSSINHTESSDNANKKKKIVIPSDISADGTIPLFKD